MASPFRIFRRYQKTLLIVAGVVLMFTFVLADALQSLMGSGVGSGGSVAAEPEADDVAVRWKNGELTNAELDELVYRRRVLNAFLQGVYGQGSYAEQLQAMSTGVSPRRQPNIDFVAQRTEQQQGVEADVVRVRLFADAARAAGMSVSDNMIGMYLDELGFGRVTRDEMARIASNNQFGGRSAPIPFLFEALREELLAHNYEKSHVFANATVMPQQRWNDWLRVYDRVSAEVAAFPAETFLVDVPEPTETELVDLYDKFKNREPQPDFNMNPELPSPYPGFRIPRKLDVQYVRADFNAMLEKIKGELTEEEIQKYYDDNKQFFVKADTAVIEKPADEKAADEKAAGATDAKQESDAGKQTTPPASDGKSEPATPASSTPAAGDGKSPAAGEGKSAANVQNVFRTVSFVQEEGKATPPAAEPQPGTSQAGPTAPPTGQPTATIPLGQPAAGSMPALDQAISAAIGEPGAATPAADAKPVEYQPLSEVREEIRRSLATPKVHARLDELMTNLRTQLNIEFQKYFTKYVDAQAAKKPLPAPPAMLSDLAPLAQEHGLEHRKTGEMSVLQLRDDEVIGKLIDIDRSSFQQQASVLSTLFSKESDLFKPIITVDLDNNRFIVMKTSDTPGRTPPLADIRDSVVRAWKLIKAAEFAEKHVVEVAKKAQAAGGTLTEYFANDTNVKVVKTDSFSELTGGDLPLQGGQLRWSQPTGLVAPGPRLLGAVFDLNEGEVGSALNHDNSIAYVFRVAEHEMPEEKLREVYLAEANTWPAFLSMQETHKQTAMAILTTAVFEAAELERVRPLDPVPVE